MTGLPVPETLAIAKQIADALEAAHEHGVVYRGRGDLFSQPADGTACRAD